MPSLGGSENLVTNSGSRVTRGFTARVTNSSLECPIGTSRNGSNAPFKARSPRLPPRCTASLSPFALPSTPSCSRPLAGNKTTWLVQRRASSAAEETPVAKPSAAPQSPSNETPNSKQQTPNTKQAESAPARKTRRWHKLADFVVGPCNRVAHASALSVIESPGETANPLVLHGPVGTGKTHLLEGIYAGLRRAHPEWKVTYITSEDFTNRFVQSMRLDKLALSASSSASATYSWWTTCTSWRPKRRLRKSSSTPSTPSLPTAGNSFLLAIATLVWRMTSRPN